MISSRPKRGERKSTRDDSDDSVQRVLGRLSLQMCTSEDNTVVPVRQVCTTIISLQLVVLQLEITLIIIVWWRTKHRYKNYHPAVKSLYAGKQRAYLPEQIRVFVSYQQPHAYQQLQAINVALRHTALRRRRCHKYVRPESRRNRQTNAWGRGNRPQMHRLI